MRWGEEAGSCGLIMNSLPAICNHSRKQVDVTDHTIWPNME